MNKLLTLCTKNVHFTFNNQVYQQKDKVAMGSLLGPVLAGIFMVELETWIVLKLGNMVLNWKRFADDKIASVKNGSIDVILSKLNTFHPNIYLQSRRRKQTASFGRPTN